MPRRAPDRESTIAGVRIPEWLDQADDPTWSANCEDSLRLVWEAFRRLKEETQDERLAATLTLAWAAHHGAFYG